MKNADLDVRSQRRAAVVQVEALGGEDGGRHHGIQSDPRHAARVVPRGLLARHDAAEAVAWHEAAFGQRLAETVPQPDQQGPDLGVLGEVARWDGLSHQIRQVVRRPLGASGE